MDSSGVDVYFLNRDPVQNVTNPQSIRHVFNSPASGLTPLVPALRRILTAKRGQSYEKKLLILIATDGYRLNDKTCFIYNDIFSVLVHQQTNMDKRISAP